MNLGHQRRGAALLSGLLFGAGLALSGMTLPAKVIGFLDITGDWDPSLAFVMMGAILVHFFAVRLARRRPEPVLGGGFQLPKKKDLDTRLVVGAAIFGVGWGLAGICPGPGLVNLLAGDLGAVAFVAAMVVGMGAQHLLVEARAGKPAPSPGGVKATS
ncbi:DUF6691 family protein [Polyangium spumosum]|uniref:YeeE/YedE family protein n=1 Tax=Polyangium spumosum TaxID=889282 RepID=A0A6N7PGQ0_9BACT|nr:DUF6691 family protein [Polyangium spumosum]MRG90967.1 YeeE/YedE family protein [Polyangium spumosum]